MRLAGVIDTFGDRLPQGGVLALDLSSNAGWCYGPISGSAAPIFGTVVLPKPFVDDPGKSLVSFENELIDLIRTRRPVRVVVEAPIMSSSMDSGFTNSATMLQQIGLYLQTLATCYRWKVHVTKRATSTVRKTVLGRGNMKRADAKATAVAYCRNKGWLVLNDDEADACVLWRYESWLMHPNGTNPSLPFATADRGETANG